MPSWPTALGGMMAAGYAATQAHKVGLDAPAYVTNALKSLGSDVASSSGRASGGSELSVLQGEVDRLHKLLSDVVRGNRGGGAVQVIHSGRGGWSVLILPTAVVGAGVFAYAKIRGLGFGDFLVVTNKSMQQFRELVSHSFTQLWEEMRKQKDEFISRITAVGQQQEQMLVQQGQMGDKLQDVSASVEDIRDISNTIEARVGQMDHTMNIMSSGVQRANEGIYLLCAAVADVTRRVGVDNSKLKVYVQAAAPELTDGNPGLRHLLDNIRADGGGAEAAAGQLAITEVVEEQAGEALLTALPTPRNSANASRLAPTGSVDLLYRRDSVRAEPARSMMGLGSIWGAAGGGVAAAGAAISGNRGRAASAANA